MKNSIIILLMIVGSCNIVFSQNPNWKDFTEGGGSMKGVTFFDTYVLYVHGQAAISTENIPKIKSRTVNGCKFICNVVGMWAYDSKERDVPNQT